MSDEAPNYRGLRWRGDGAWVDISVSKLTEMLARLDAAEREREAFAERVFRHGFSDGWTANQKGRLAASASVDEAWHFYVADGALQKSVALTANHSQQDQEQ
jgi:hypothetical protein